MSDLKRLLGRVVNKLRDDGLEQGTLGVHRPDTSVDMQVTGRAGWLHVTLNGQTPVKAYNKAGVPQTTDLQVDMRVIDGRRVIVGVSSFDNLSVPVPVPPSGVLAHPISEHSDATITAAASGDVLAHNGTAWVDEAPITTSAGAGDAGKLVRLDAGGQIDATMIAAEDIAAKIDGATVSSTMTTTDKIAAVIGGVLRYFTYQTIRDAIKSYYDSVVATLTNKSIDASANTLTNIGTSALSNDAVSNTKLANMAQDTIKGRASGAGTGDPTDLTAAQVLTILTSVISAAFWTFTNKIAIAATATSGAALSVVRDLASGSTDSAVFELIQENASDDQPALYVRQDGSGDIAQFYDGTHKLVAVGDDGKLYVILPTGNSVNMGLEITGQDGGYMRFRNGTGGTDDFDPSMDAVGDTESTIGFNFVARPYVDASGSIGMLISPRTEAGAALTAARLMEVRNYLTTVFGVEYNGDVAIGSHTAQGRLHAHDGTGGFMFVTKTSINGTAQTIIPNGTGDVVYFLDAYCVWRDSAGNTNSIIRSVAPGGSTDIVNDGGSNVLTLAVAANGAVTVQRTAGSRTYTVAMRLLWL